MSALPTMMPQFSRFHAIVPASPVQADEPPILSEPPTYGTWNVRFDSGKRSREPSDPGPSKPRKATKRIVDEENKREPTTKYRDGDGLLSALKESFKEGPNVDFAGVFDMADTGVTHKERVQLFVHDIWKTTGYRFTVKDHPQFTNGHKTRFWCSQDEAHRSKSSKAARKAQGDGYKPRVTSAGEVLAKNRFPCRSRLLVSSRDSKTPGLRSITVRMHHHLNHEPYVDTSFPPDVLQNFWDNFGTAGYPAPSLLSNHSSRAGDEGAANSNFLVEDDGESSDSDSVSSEERFDEQPVGHVQEQNSLDAPITFVHHINHPPPPPHQPQLSSHRREHHQQQQQQQPHPHQHQLPPPSEKYHNRMKAHIKNLREFCDGLEYQLQFNDYRMLDVLEHEGGPFLTLVADCLKKEGRLAPVEQSPNIPGPHHHVSGISVNALPLHQQQRIPVHNATTSQRSALSISTTSSQHPSITISQHTPISIGSAGSQQHNSIPIGSASSQHPPGYMPLHLISDNPLDTNRTRTYEGNPGINPRALGY